MKFITIIREEGYVVCACWTSYIGIVYTKSQDYVSVDLWGRLITPTVITPAVITLTVISQTLITLTVITPTLINTLTMHPGLYHHILSNRNSKQL